MGETQKDLSQILDEAMDEKETEVVEETQETETIAPDVSETEETEEAVQETETTTDVEEGNRLDPLFGRLKDVSDNDRDMMTRWHQGSQERDAIQGKFEEAERRIAELEGRETYADQAAKIFAAVTDPETLKYHEEYRATHNDREYCDAIQRQKVEDQYRDPPPEEDLRDKAMREMQYRVEQMEKGNKEREDAQALERGKTLFQEHSTKAWGELKVPDKYRAYLSKALHGAYAVSQTKITTFAQLRTLAKDVWEEFEPHLKSEQAATKEALKEKTTKVAPKKVDDDEPEEELVTDDLEKFTDAKSLLKHGMDKAMEGLSETGAA